MTAPALQDAKAYRRWAIAAASLSVILIAIGGVVRITGSGLGCGDHWPRCNGEWFPPLDLPTLIEISHRWAAGLVSISVVGLTLTAWRRHRSNSFLRGPATLAALLLVVQVLLGPVIVKLDLPPAVVVLHLVNAMVLVGALVVAVLRSMEAAPPGTPLRRAEAPRPEARLIHFTATWGFLVIILGALVANLNAGLLCQGFPFCGSGVGPPASTLGMIHWLHRMMAFGLVGLLLAVHIRLGRGAGAGSSLRRTSWAALIAATAQIGVGAAMVLRLLPTPLRALHLFTGTLVWVALVALVYRSRRDTAAPSADPVEPAPSPAPSLLADLVTLTKPRIISLLLVTTVAPMFITPAGLPPAGLVFWVVVAGYLMAGGANAINMWFDRDIDDKMTRTRLRPVPSGRLAPWEALAFGGLLACVAFLIFWNFVNPLSAWLALGGLAFYVLVYTVWLKRTSPQNIVIGGAAGAFPPLVGWAAVTGRLDLAAVYLFAIIFYWTPPHFWALALIKQGEYARAGVPMMPVVRGERHTKVQMLVYTLMLIPLTVMPSVFGALGLFYGVAAALLGARLLWYSLKLLRESAVTPTAWKMYRYSLIYLALLFVAMGVDRALPFGHAREAARGRQPVLILDHPDGAASVSEADPAPRSP